MYVKLLTIGKQVFHGSAQDHQNAGYLQALGHTPNNF